MSVISKLYHNYVASSPKAEVMMRKFYWNNVKLFQRYKISNHVEIPTQSINLDNIKTAFLENGVSNDDIMVVHSAFSPFKKQYKGEQVLQMLLDTVPNGTVAMPAIRYYPEDEPYVDYIHRKYNGIVSVYDVKNTKITSGYLPILMTKDTRSFISRCPHNPLVAIGKHAEEMMEGNIDMDFITAHGTGSCWDYCAKHDAWNIGLGIPVEGFLTIFHNTQECGDWPIKNWFFPREFKVIDGEFEKNIIFQERIHLSTMYYAETNFNNDMLSSGVMKSFEVNGVPILMTKTSVLFDFIREKMKKYPTYPYFFPKRFLK